MIIMKISCSQARFSINTCDLNNVINILLGRHKTLEWKYNFSSTFHIQKIFHFMPSIAKGNQIDKENNIASDKKNRVAKDL